MKKKSLLRDEAGVVAVLVALTILFLLMMLAFALDIGHLMVVRNEVQNAADAGALAGARQLYSSVSGTVITVNPGANELAASMATTNQSDRIAVEAPPVNIEKGHWCFTCTNPSGGKGLFTPNDSLSSFSLTSLSFTDLDTDPNYINAVRVKGSRGPEVPAASYFARIFGAQGFSVNAEAVAWVGFAGSHFQVDVPLAICRQSMLGTDGKEHCTGGKLVNSNVETGAWTNLKQDETTCTSAANKTSVMPLICSGEQIPFDLQNGLPITLVNGEVQPLVAALRDCWLANATLDSNSDKIPDHVWKFMVPMIDCDDTSPICKTLIGAIDLQVYWITANGSDPHYNKIPTLFYYDENQPPYICPSTSMSSEEGRKACWLDFLSKFGVTDENNQPYTLDNTGYTPNTIYFKPNCEFKHEGTSGGAASNVLAEIPKLVK